MPERDWKVIEGDCVEQMRAMDEASVDAVVCDPPYLIGFMGKEFDSQHKTFVERKSNRRAGSFEAEHGNHNPIDSQDQQRTRLAEGRRAQAWHEAWAVEALRVLKPGGHLLAFGGTRTYHRLACAIEDAGFEIRDTIAWLYGSGFPKSLDVAKAIDAQAGAVRESRPDPRWFDRYPNGNGGTGSGNTVTGGHTADGPMMTSDPATPDAERWQGWGTALKPAHEPIVVARKPLAGNVAQNVLAHGTGALNVDGCRIDFRGADGGWGATQNNSIGYHGGTGGEDFRTSKHDAGRWPANVVLDPEAAAMLDAQTGESTSSDRPRHNHARADDQVFFGQADTIDRTTGGYADSGGASRFYYVAKASSAERNAGLDGFEAVPKRQDYGDGFNSATKLDPAMHTAEGVAARPLARNPHPTVKPIDLMRWLVRLVTPLGGLVLDPFAGSGTTGAAAILEGFRFVGIEREAEYAAIARARIAWWAEHPDGMELVQRLEAEKARKAVAEAGQLDLFA